ncbi:hypothetical protein FQA39_LY08335 [Lamprigera yunnana]|nr:hypothetical protein FQA39_LY08335 [Lamprigera yunnana]
MGKAYLRELKHRNQCELVFKLKLVHTKSRVLINEEIHCHRPCTDVIKSLLVQTERKIVNILKMKKISDIIAVASLTVNGVDVKGDVKCKEFMDTPKKNIIFTIAKQSFEVIINAPLVKELLLPKVIFVNHLHEPIKFRCIYATKHLSEFIWYSSSDKVLWTIVQKSFEYKPTMHKLGKYLKLKCIPKNSEAEGPTFAVICETPVAEISLPAKCPFNERHLYTNTWLKEQNQLRVVSYNILSNLYAEIVPEPLHCSPHAISIHYRKELILKELLGYQADVICLQEVEQNIYNLDIKPKLSNTYRGSFHKKGFKIPVGLACFFNVEKFRSIEVNQIVFREELPTNPLFADTWNLISQCNTLKDRILKLPTSLQVTVLQSKIPDENVIIANVQLYDHVKANLERLVQCSIALDYIKDIYNKYKHFMVGIIYVKITPLRYVPTSQVYQFIMNGFIQCTVKTDIGKSEKTISLRHPFQFGSAYGTPKYTNYSIDFKGCLDYIFYDSTSLDVIDCVPLPDESVLVKNVALPNEVFPSNHLALVASYIQKCHLNDPQLQQCLLKVVENLQPHLADGVPELKFPSLNPFVIPLVNLEFGGNALNYKVALTDTNIYGLHDFKFSKLEYNPQTLAFDGFLTFNALSFDTNFDINGRILAIQINGKGTFKCVMGPSTGSLKVSGELVERNGKRYYNPVDVITKIAISNYTGTFEFEAGKNQELATALNMVLNENSKEFLDEVLPELEKTASEILRRMLVSLSNDISYDELFL